MSEAYAPPATPPGGIHRWPDGLTPQTIYETLVGLRDRRQRRRIIHPDVAHYGLDLRLRTGRVERVVGDVQGSRAFLVLLVRLSDGTLRAVTVILDRRSPTPVVSAVVL